MKAKKSHFRHKQSTIILTGKRERRQHRVGLEGFGYDFEALFTNSVHCSEENQRYFRHIQSTTMLTVNIKRPQRCVGLECLADVLGTLVAKSIGCH